MQRRISRYRGLFNENFSSNWEWLIRAIDSNISNCPILQEESHEIYTRVRCRVINQHDSLVLRKKKKTKNYYRFLRYHSAERLTNKGKKRNRTKSSNRYNLCTFSFVHGFDGSCWCIARHPVGRLYHDVEKVETIGYRCLAHVLLTVPWLRRRSLCTCLLPAWPVRYINIFLVLSRYQTLCIITR